MSLTDRIARLQKLQTALDLRASQSADILANLVLDPRFVKKITAVQKQNAKGVK